MSKQVWLITGVSNGFSLLPALKALAAGHSVIGTVRSKTKSADAVRQITDAGGHVIELEMTDSQNNIIAAIHDAEKTYGQVEVLVNNAGYTILGALEQFSEEEVNLQYQTNVFGPLFVTQAVLPGMRARRRGTIVCMSSSTGQDPSLTCCSSSWACFAPTFSTRARRSPRAPLPDDDYRGGAVGQTNGLLSGADGARRGATRRGPWRGSTRSSPGEGLAGHLKGQVLRAAAGDGCGGRHRGQAEACAGRGGRGEETGRAREHIISKLALFTVVFKARIEYI